MIEPGCQFASDNTAGICPEAFEAFTEANAGYHPSYGDDPITRAACDAFRELFGTHCDVYLSSTALPPTPWHWLPFVTLTRASLPIRPPMWRTDECGAPEFFSNGSKLILAQGDNGKLDVSDVERLFTGRRDLHFPKPRGLSISQSTEYGTVYQIDELRALWVWLAAMAFAFRWMAPALPMP